MSGGSENRPSLDNRLLMKRRVLRLQHVRLPRSGIFVLSCPGAEASPPSAVGAVVRWIAETA
jgi:hypothetical protein